MFLCFCVLFVSSLETEDFHLISVGYDWLHLTLYTKVLLLLKLNCHYGFRFVVPFLSCYSISYFLFRFLSFALLLLWCEERSKTVVGIDICYSVLRSTICSLITFGHQFLKGWVIVTRPLTDTLLIFPNEWFRLQGILL